MGVVDDLPSLTTPQDTSRTEERRTEERRRPKEESFIERSQWKDGLGWPRPGMGIAPILTAFTDSG